MEAHRDIERLCLYLHLCMRPSEEVVAMFE